MGVPPVAVISIDPSEYPKQEGSIKVAVEDTPTEGSVIVTIMLSVQSNTSFTSMVYVPAAKLENILEDCQVVPPSMEY